MGYKKPVKCDDCNKKTRRPRIIKGKFLCYQCSVKEINLMPNSHIQKMEKVLNKTYEVRGYLSKKGTITASCTFPSILIGHKFKIKLI